MKRKLLILTVAAMLFALPGCDEESHNWPTGGGSELPEGPKGDVAEYTLRQVLQYDPVNVEGINIVDELDFFGDLKLTLWLTDGEMTALEFSNGSVPFFPYSFNAPAGKVECLLDTSVKPNQIRIKETNEVVASFDNGEFVIDFQLDSKLVNYRYTFKTMQ